MSGRTGPAIRTEYGHIHRLEGNTSTDESHQHKYDTETSRPFRD